MSTLLVLLLLIGGGISVTALSMVVDTCMEELMYGEAVSWNPWTADPLAAAMAMMQAFVRRMIIYYVSVKNAL